MPTKIVGILNITPDSFSDGGRFNSLDSSLVHLKKMLADGADMIDVGAESTRPGAVPISAEEEWQRLEKILPMVISEVKKFSKNSGKNVQTSIDSYHFETIKKSHELGVDVINDVSGLVDEKIIEFIAAKNITTILMHNLAIHASTDLVINKHLNVNSEILDWAERKISYLTQKGVKKSQLIFDPGIGFAKDAEQSIRILKNIDSYRVLGLPIYVGHSRKRFLENVFLENYELESLAQRAEKKIDRDEKTLIVSKFLMQKNVDFLRIHDVQSHVLLRKTINS